MTRAGRIPGGVRRQLPLVLGITAAGVAAAFVCTARPVLAPLAIATLLCVLAFVARPHVGLVAYVLLLLSLPAFARDVEAFARGVRVDQVVLVVLFCLLLARFLLGRARVRADATVLLYCAYLLAYAASIAISSIVAGAAPGLEDLVSWQGHLRPLLAYLVCREAIRSHSQARSTVLAVLLVGAAVVALGLLQFLRIEPVYTLLITYYARKFHFDSVLASQRVYAVFDGQPNAFGVFLVMYVTLGVSLFGHDVRGARSRTVLPVLVGAGLAALVVTESRAAWAATAISLAVVGCLSGPRVLPVLIPGLLAAGSVLVLHRSSLQSLEALLRFEGRGGAPMFAGRLAYWGPAIEMFAESPLLGRGAVQVLDSLYLRELACRGIVGLFLLIGLLGTVMRQAWRTFSGSPRGLGRALSCGLVGITAGLLLHGVGHPSFHLERTSELYWVLMGLVMSLRDLDAGVQAPRGPTLAH